MKFPGIGLLLVLTSVMAAAQTNGTQAIVSPEVHPDGRVTFRVKAPKAAEVAYWGDWMPQQTSAPMSRDDHGVWSATTGPLEPGLAIYTLTIDGVTLPDPVNPLIKRRARTSASFVDVPARGDELWAPGDVPHGVVEARWEKSAAAGDTRAFYVYTPPDYRLNSAKRYPVVYLLHGNNDTAAGWTDAGKANFIIDNLVARKKAVPMILVMPWGHAVPYDGPQTNNTALVERYLIEEVIPRVEADYRVAPGRDNRAIVGLSMGGGHALHIGLGHSDLFASVAAFSFAIPFDFEHRFKNLLADADGTNAKMRLIWLGCGRQDPAFARNRGLAELLASRHVRNTFEEIEGMHNYTVWRKLLGDVAPLLFKESAVRE